MPGGMTRRTTTDRMKHSPAVEKAGPTLIHTLSLGNSDTNRESQSIFLQLGRSEHRGAIHPREKSEQSTGTSEVWQFIDEHAGAI